MRPRPRPSPEPPSPPPAFGAAASEAFAPPFFPVGMAVRRNSRSPHTTGVESPEPGTLTFHFTWFVSSHLSGGSASGATPVASGPRHCGQNSLPPPALFPSHFTGFFSPPLGGGGAGGPPRFPGAPRHCGQNSLPSPAALAA